MDEELFNEATVNGEEDEEEQGGTEYLLIDHNFRKITIPSTKQLAGVTSDEDVNIIHFKCPKVCTDVDLSEFDFRINYMNAGDEGDIYLVRDKKVEGDYITFSWMIHRNACKYAGNIQFIVCAKLFGDTEDIVREYNTAIHTLRVAQGLETTEDLRPDYDANTDAIEQFLKNLQTVYMMSEDIENLKSRADSLELDLRRKFDDAYKDDEGYLYFASEGQTILGPIGPFAGGGGGGGGGGGSTVTAKLTARNTTGWLAKTIASSSPCPVSINWTSIQDDIPTGPGTLKITVNSVVKSLIQVQQGDVQVDLAPYCGTGPNSCTLLVTDIYGNSWPCTFQIMVTQLSLSSSFDNSVPFTGDIDFPYTPVGSIAKTVHFILDGTEIGQVRTSATNRQLTYRISAQNHGSHTLRVYFDAIINGEAVKSNELYYEFISINAESNDVIIISEFNTEHVSQYTSIQIPYRVYDPLSDTCETKLYVNNNLVSTQTVDRTAQSYTYRANTAGEVIFTISAGYTVKEIRFTVDEVEIEIQAEESNLALYLNAQGRSNNEATRDVWSYYPKTLDTTPNSSKRYYTRSGEAPNYVYEEFYGSRFDAETDYFEEPITAGLHDFNWILDGWQTDEDGINVMRLVDDARLVIPYRMFETDFKAKGKTIEIEFATRQVVDYTAEILTCWANNMGLKITPQNVVFQGAQTEIDTLFKENEHLRLSIVVEKQTSNRLILVYINGVMSRAVQYASGERFSQLSPVEIEIGSNLCGIDIYNIRVYDNDLNRNQVLDNWIADTQIGDLMMTRYQHNQVYNASGEITIQTLPTDLPYWIIEARELPQFKGDKKIVSGSYTVPGSPARSFTFEGCQINVQGTSSSVYFRKNYDLQFLEGFIMQSGIMESYAIRVGSIPFNRFVLKADVASSESANNTELTMLYNDICPYRTPAMQENPKVRYGIEGIPVVVFWYNPDTDETSFLGKYNFNLPKRAPEPYGYSSDGTMESWEWERNNSANVKFQDIDFTSTSVDEDGETYPTWYDDFEARFPSDKHRDYSKLREFNGWVLSTWRDKATGNNLPEEVTYRLTTKATLSDYASDTSYTVTEVKVGNATQYDITFTKDTAAYRLTKFRAEASQYFELDSGLFYYLFTELFLMIDSRAKNMFIGFDGSPVT